MILTSLRNTTSSQLPPRALRFTHTQMLICGVDYCNQEIFPREVGPTFPARRAHLQRLQERFTWFAHGLSDVARHMGVHRH